MMRVVGGLYRHRIISWPDDVKHTRPTKDRIREAIFSALGDINNKSCLDLYAGSGAMGIEALSRGCHFSAFVDIAPIALKTIKNNLETIQVPKDQYRIFDCKDTNAIDLLSNENQKFDIVILDPPYKEGKYIDIIKYMDNKEILSNTAIIVCESDHPLTFDEIKFIRKRDYKYGDIFVTILWR